DAVARMLNGQDMTQLASGQVKVKALAGAQIQKFCRQLLRDAEAQGARNPLPALAFPGP
ncbi:unnamed protein product, partial [Prorocentrum cordatum]